MKEIAIIIFSIFIGSCNANKSVAGSRVGQEGNKEGQIKTTQIAFISGTRQKVFPGQDDGTGRYTENWILKLDTHKGFSSKMSLELNGYIIPINNKIVFSADTDDAILMFSITYPLTDNYKKSDKEKQDFPVLILKNGDATIELNLSECKVLTPIAYPSAGKGGRGF